MLYSHPQDQIAGNPSLIAPRGGADQGFAVRDLLNSIFFHRRAALIVAGTILLIGILAAVLMPASYSAEAQLLPLGTGVYDTREANGPPQPGQALDPASVTNVELQLLDSLDLHRTLVAADMGPSPDPAAVNRALDRFEKRLHVTKINDTNVIQLTYTDRDPQAAADVLRRLIAGYFEARANALTAGRVRYLEQQRDQVKAQMDAADARLTAFQQQHGIADIAAQIDGAVKQNDALRQSAADAAAALADQRHTGAAIRGALGHTPSQVELYSDNTEAARALGEMRTQLLQLQAKRADVAARFMAGSPQVQQLDAQISALDKSLRQQQAALVDTRRMGRNQVYDNSRDRLAQAEASASGIAARQSAIAGQLAQSEARLRQLNATSEQLNRLRMDRDVLAENYKSLALQVGQARVQLNQDRSAGNPSVRIIEAPTPPSKRNNPPLLIIAASVVAALLLSGAAVFVLASLRAVFLTPAEVEKATGLPVLAAPLEGHRPHYAPSGFGRFHALIDTQAHRDSKAILLVTDTSFNALQKAAMGLGRDIQRHRPGSVLLLRFGPDGWDPADLARMPVENFEGMGVAALSLDALGKGEERALIERLQTRYDYVVIVPPPTREDVGALRLAQVADHVSVVVVAEKTRRPVLTDLLRDLDQMEANLLGLVLLDRRSHIPQIIYRLIG